MLPWIFLSDILFHIGKYKSLQLWFFIVLSAKGEFHYIILLRGGHWDKASLSVSKL